MNEPNVVVFARTIADRTDAEVISFVDQLPGLLSKATQNERVARDRILHDLARRVVELAEVNEVGCGRVSCLYPQRIGLVAGVDVSIDGDVWPGSRYARHIARCPWHQTGRRDTVVAMYTSEEDRADARGADPATMAAIRRVRTFQKQADAAGYGRPPEEEPMMEDCRLCNGSGMVAVGPWGARPPREACRECEGRGKVSTAHVYADPSI